jgi:hypothetical protein
MKGHIAETYSLFHAPCKFVGNEVESPKLFKAFSHAAGRLEIGFGNDVGCKIYADLNCAFEVDANNILEIVVFKQGIDGRGGFVLDALDASPQRFDLCAYDLLIHLKTTFSALEACGRKEASYLPD